MPRSKTKPHSAVEPASPGYAAKPEYGFMRDPNPQGDCVFLRVPALGEWEDQSETYVHGLSRTTALRLKDELEAALSPPHNGLISGEPK